MNNRKRRKTRNNNSLRNMFIGFGTIFIFLVVGLVILDSVRYQSLSDLYILYPSFRSLYLHFFQNAKNPGL